MNALLKARCGKKRLRRAVAGVISIRSGVVAENQIDVVKACCQSFQYFEKYYCD